MTDDLKRAATLSFDDGLLAINLSGYGDKDGAGRISFEEERLDWGHGEDSHWRLMNLPKSELEAIRDFLSEHMPSTKPHSAEITDDNDGEYLTELRRAQAIIDRLKAYRERLLTMPCQCTDLMRARIRELATPARDDYDRAVLALLDDFEKMERLTKASVK